MGGEGTALMLSETVSRSRRTRWELIARVLNASRGRGVKKTHLMYQCGMSFTQLEKYLDLILEARLIQVQDDNPHFCFRISGKGRKFLKAYESLKALME